MTTRRTFLQALAAGGGAAALSGGLARASTQPWNVLVLCADEHNATALSSEGHPDAWTPNLDALSAQGAFLERCYVSSPVCAPTRQSWLTGLHPEEHGQLGNEYLFDMRNEALPEVFQALGYETACFGKLHTQSSLEEDGALGFDRLLSEKGSSFSAAMAAWRQQSLGRFDVPTDEDWSGMPFQGFDGRRYQDPALVPDWVLTQEALRWLGQTRAAPFFCYLSLRAPHYPFWLPEDHYGLFHPGDVTLPVVDPYDLEDSPGGQRAAAAYSWASMTETQTRLVMARYMDSVSFADAMFGQVLSALAASGQAQRTLVLYLSDHGDMLGEKGLWLKNVPFEGAMRKPAILRMPGVVPAGARLKQLVSEVDILPTLLGLVGGHASIPTGLSGRDLSESVLLEAHGVPQRTWLRDHGVRDNGVVHSSNFFSTVTEKPWLRTVVEDRFKLNRYRRTSGVTSYELYDLNLDSEETTNVAESGDYSDVVNRLADEIEDFEASRREPEFGPQVA